MRWRRNEPALLDEAGEDTGRLTYSANTSFLRVEEPKDPERQEQQGEDEIERSDT